MGAGAKPGQHTAVALAEVFGPEVVTSTAGLCEDDVLVWEHRAAAQSVCVPPMQHVTLSLMRNDFAVVARFADGRRHARTARRDELTLLACDEPFALDLQAPAHLFNVSLSPRLLHLAASQTTGDAIALPTRLTTQPGIDDPVLRTLVTALHLALGLHRPARGLHQLVRQTGLAIAGHLLHHHGMTGPAVVPGVALDGVSVRVMRYLNERAGEPCALAELARWVGLSTTHLCRRFKLATGLTPKQYHLRLRLERAQQALRSGGANVTQAAMDAGFDNMPHFSRLFRKHYGRPPSAYLA